MATSLFAMGFRSKHHICAYLFATSLLICAASVTGAVDGLEETQDPDPGNWQRMLRRDTPRSFERFPDDVLEYIRQGNGFYTQVASTTVWQAANSSKTDRDNLLNTNYNFAGGWEPMHGAAISWWLRGGRPVGEPRNANLSTDIGSILDINASLESKDLFLRELYWVQMIGDRFNYSLGWIDSSYRYDFNAAANDDAGAFLSSALVNSPTIPFPDSSIAGDIQWQMGDHVDLHLGIYQTNCNKDSLTCIDRLDSDDWLIPVEFIFKTRTEAWGAGNYRFLVFTTRENESSGSGFSVSVDQEAGRITPFLRFSIADSEITDIKRFISLGAVYRAPLTRQGDELGVGIASGDPSDAAKREESLLEVFWRFQLNPFVAVTPDIQLVFNPADNPSRDRIVVAGMRLQLDF